MTLSPKMTEALIGLQAAAAGGSTTGAVQPGWGYHLTTLRALEALGYAVVTDHPAYGYVRRGRWIKGQATWSARITDAGRAAVAEPSIR